MAVVALILTPISALLFMLTRRITVRWLAVGLLGIAVALLFASMTLWAGAAGALLRKMSFPTSLWNSFVLATVMAVYCAAVAGGSWMSAVGIRRLEEKA